MEENKIKYRIFLSLELIEVKDTKEEAVRFIEDNFKAEYLGEGSDGFVYQTKDFTLSVAEWKQK